MWLRSAHRQACHSSSRSVTQQTGAGRYTPLQYTIHRLVSDGWLYVKSISPFCATHSTASQIKYHFDSALREGLPGMGWIGTMHRTRPYNSSFVCLWVQDLCPSSNNFDDHARTRVMGMKKGGSFDPPVWEVHRYFITQVRQQTLLHAVQAVCAGLRYPWG